MLAEQTAGSPSSVVNKLLAQITPPAVSNAKKEGAAIQAM